MKALTEKQIEVLAFIDTFQRQYGYSPTYREIAMNFGITSKAIFDQINAIRRKGYLTNVPRKARVFTIKKDYR